MSNDPISPNQPPAESDVASQTATPFVAPAKPRLAPEQSPAELIKRSVAVALNTLFGPCLRSGFGILMYHRVSDIIVGQPRPTWNVTPAQLEEQLSGLLRRGFTAWPLQRALEHHEKRRPFPRGVFVVTFDDGYQNNFTQAFPILKGLGIPATVFLATRYLDSSQAFPNDSWHLAGSPIVPAETWRPLTTAECLLMHQSGLIELAAHTHSHDDYRGRPGYLLADLQECCAVLSRKFGIERPSFALPYGTKHNGFAGPELLAVARQSGVRCCLTTEPELVTAQADPFDWSRLFAGDFDTSATLAAKLNGWFSLARRFRRRPS